MALLIILSVFHTPTQLLALLTSGEGNHNFHHAFPRDFRNGPHPADWDPTKWIIYLLHIYTPFVPSVAVTPEADILKAQAQVLRLQAGRLTAQVPLEDIAKPEHELPTWSVDQTLERAQESGKVLVLIDGFVVDVSEYIHDHVSSSRHLASYPSFCASPR